MCHFKVVYPLEYDLVAVFKTQVKLESVLKDEQLDCNARDSDRMGNKLLPGTTAEGESRSQRNMIMVMVGYTYCQYVQSVYSTL